MAATLPEELAFASMQPVDVRGCTIEMFTAGSGEPLLFLHGMDGVEGAAAAIRELAKRYTVYAPSHPGFGQSERPANLDQVDDLGYFYLDLIDTLSLVDPVFVGTSFGSWVACEILTKDPTLARSLVMASPLGLPTANRREQNVADIFMMSRQDLNGRMGLEPEGPGEMEDERLRREMLRDEALSLYAWTPYMHNPKLADRLHRITCPTLLIWGEDDAIVKSAYRQTFSEAMPSAQVKIAPGAGHALHSDIPEIFAAMIGSHTGSKHIQEAHA